MWESAMENPWYSKFTAVTCTVTDRHFICLKTVYG